MDIGAFGFYLISALLVSLAIAMVSTKKLVHSIIFMFMFIVMVAASLLYINSVFLSIAELIIYNGGIVLLLAIGISLLPEGVTANLNYKTVFAIPIVLLAVTSYLLIGYPSHTSTYNVGYGNLGLYLFQNFGPLLVVVAFTALTSLIAAVFILGEERIRW
jgi:NADH-ubiquinone/plastoquinone oxidoreductase chain 6.